MKVAVAVIMDSMQRFLIVRRPMHIAHGGLWEFPGGKLETKEMPRSALVREIKEEVGLTITNCNFLGEVNHIYNDRRVSLLVYFVNQFEGEAWCCESQMDLLWVNWIDLPLFKFPAANEKIMELLEKKISNFDTKRLHLANC